MSSARLSGPRSARPPALFAAALGLGVMGLLASGPGCVGQANPGFDPPDDRIWFPAGLALDPRVTSTDGATCQDGECTCEDGWILEGIDRCVKREASRYLFVANANSDLRFNASALMAIDLDAFHCRRQNKEASGCTDAQAGFGGGASDTDWKVKDPGDSVDSVSPCRRIPTKPEVVECDEAAFIDDSKTVHMGNFASVVSGWKHPSDGDKATLMVPVRGDPSVVWATVSGGLGSNDLRIECGQGNDPDERDARMCDDDHRLRFLDGDEDNGPIGSEPTNIHIRPRPLNDNGSDLHLAYLTHAADQDLSLLSLHEDGPRIIDRKFFMQPGNFQILPGGIGIAERPCDIDDAPNASLGCTRPMVYAGLRYQRTIVAANVLDLDPDGSSANEDDFEFNLVHSFFAGGISPSTAAGSPQVGDMAFSGDGNELFAVQSNPGGLMRIDTSIQNNGTTRDLAAGVVELCPRATAMALYQDGQDEYAMVTCYRSGVVFAVDLSTLKVISTIRVGTGPHQLLIDLPRQMVYVANSLEATISAIDMARDSESRFAEVARLGLQDPFSND